MHKIIEIKQQIKQLQLDSIVITTMEHVHYLTSFTGSSGAVIITASQSIFITDPRYENEAKHQIKNYDVVISGPTESLADCIVIQLSKLNTKKIGFESGYITYLMYKQLQEQLQGTLIPTTNIVESLRKVKDESEINKLKDAAEICDRAFSRIVEYIEPGMTEKEVAIQLECMLLQEGADSKAFDTIVASGYRSALPHGAPSEKVIEKGDIIMLDFGAIKNNYYSDMTRMVSIGQPDARLKEIHQIVLDALLLCTEKLKPGMPTQEVNKLVRNYFAKFGYEDYFIHTAGHGIGLMISEEPLFSRTTKTNHAIESGMVTTIEPGIYLPNIGGVRIEDMVVIRNGENEVLTKSPKQLMIL